MILKFLLRTFPFENAHTMCCINANIALNHGTTVKLLLEVEIIAKTFEDIDEWSTGTNDMIYLVFYEGLSQTGASSGVMILGSSFLPGTEEKRTFSISLNKIRSVLVATDGTGY